MLACSSPSIVCGNIAAMNNKLKIGVAIASSATRSYHRPIGWAPLLVVATKTKTRHPCPAGVDALSCLAPVLVTLLIPPNHTAPSPMKLGGNAPRPEPTNITAALSAFHEPLLLPAFCSSSYNRLIRPLASPFRTVAVKNVITSRGYPYHLCPDIDHLGRHLQLTHGTTSSTLAIVLLLASTEGATRLSPQT